MARRTVCCVSHQALCPMFAVNQSIARRYHSIAAPPMWTMSPRNGARHDGERVASYREESRMRKHTRRSGWLAETFNEVSHHEHHKNSVDRRDRGRWRMELAPRGGANAAECRAAGAGRLHDAGDQREVPSLCG